MSNSGDQRNASSSDPGSMAASGATATDGAGAAGGEWSPGGGRVVRLHFACRAPLPVGSSLRVTGSSLWAPTPAAHSITGGGTSNSSVASSATVASPLDESSAPFHQTGSGVGGGTPAGDHAYASSVEMVTCPDTYPIWRTRTPVVVTVHPNQRLRKRGSSLAHHSGGSVRNLNYSPDRRGGDSTRSLDESKDDTTGGGGGSSQNRIHHHRYRYLVVTPGAGLIHDFGTATASASANPSPTNNNNRAVTPSDSDDGSSGAGKSNTTAPEQVEVEAREEIPAGVGIHQRESSNTPLGAFAAATGTGVASSPGDNNHEFIPLTGGMREDSLLSAGAGSTSNDVGDGSFPVTLWEDPFLPGSSNNKNGGGNGGSRPASRSPSASSLAPMGRKGSGGGPGGVRNLVNLPFRTVDVDTEHASVVVVDEETKGEEGGAASVEYTSDGVRIDRWNDPDDAAWGPYIQRVDWSKHQKVPSKRGMDLSSDSEGSDMADVEAAMYGTTMDDDAAADEEEEKVEKDKTEGENVEEPSDEKKKKKGPKAKPTLHLTCYHLPVNLSRDPDTDAWRAEWSDSIIANTDNVVSRHYEKHWIGTVSPPGGLRRLTEADREEITEMLGRINCTPLFLDPDVRSSHYLGMCKQVLWPAFHNIDLLDLSTSGWGQRDVFGSPTSPSAVASAAAAQPGGAATTTTGGTTAAATTTAAADMGGGTPKPQPPADHVSDWDQSRLDGWWEAYTTVNRTFADAVARVVKPNDIMWMHDYHLALLPKMLDEDERARYGQRITKMVFFLHIPFPTSQIFRELECGEAILEGMLQADVVGFHAFDHARHFLNAGKRILGLSYESLVGGLIGVRYMGRVVLVTISNVSVEANLVDAALALPSVTAGANGIRAKHGNRVIICGIDIAQRLSGVSLKLLAYERLLSDYPVWQGKVVLVQKCLVPNSRQVDELTTLRELRYLVRRIHDKFGAQVIDYEEIQGSSVPIEQRLALWNASECFIETPVREGLNLLPLEYIYSRKDRTPAGVTITSEFSAVCSILNGALRVNPFDIQMTATSIDKALTMDVPEREGRRCRDIDFVASCPSSKWTKNVLRDLKEATMTGPNDEEEDLEVTDKEAASSIGGFLAREAEIHFSYVDVDSISAAYKATSRRVIIMDFNGTLVVKEPPGKYLKRDILGTSGFKPPTSVLKSLADLCSDPQNTVVVVSGDSQMNVENAVGNIPGLYLAASNGACFALPLKSGESHRKWHSFDLGVNWDGVKQVSLPVLSKYTARTNGSFVKLTHSSIGWSYYSADPEWGSLQASHLVLELEHALQTFDVRIVTLKGIVEIVPRILNKGLIVKKFLREVAARNDGYGPDFILCMGDDISDEKMFTSVFSFIAEMDEDYSNVVPSPPVLVSATGSDSGDGGFLMQENPSVRCKNSNEPIYSFTIAVGKKPSHASQYVDDAMDVAYVLVAMTGGDPSTVISESMSWDSEEAGTDRFA